VRLAALIAYRPALFYSDSWGYLKMARGPRLVAIAPTRPSGYPLALRLFGSPRGLGVMNVRLWPREQRLCG